MTAQSGVDQVMFEAAALADRNAGPVGVSVLVCTGDPDIAREAAPRLAALLYPGRRFGAVLHVEPAEPPDHWMHRHHHGHTEAIVEEVRS